MESKIEKRIEFNKIILVVSVIAIMFMVYCTNIVFAASVVNTEASTSTNKYSFQFDFGTGVSSDRILTIKWKIKTNGTANYSEILAISGILKYDESTFESPNILGANGFSATFNAANGKFVLDASGFTEGQEIATITLKAKDLSSDVNTEIGISDLQFASGDSDTEINKSYLKIGDVKVPANVKNGNAEKNNQNTNNNGNAQNNQNANNNGSAQNNQNANNNGSAQNNQNANNNGSAQNNQNKNENKAEYISPIKKDTTTSNKPIPQTGKKITIYVIMGAIIVIGIVTFIRYKKFYD